MRQFTGSTKVYPEGEVFALGVVMGSTHRGGAEELHEQGFHLLFLPAAHDFLDGEFRGGFDSIEIGFDNFVIRVFGNGNPGGVFIQTPDDEFQCSHFQHVPAALENLAPGTSGNHIDIAIAFQHIEETVPVGIAAEHVEKSEEVGYVVLDVLGVDGFETRAVCEVPLGKG